MDTPTFKKMLKPKNSRSTNHKIEAFERSEKTKFEDIRNLLGLDSELLKIISPYQSQREEETLALHSEIRERLNTYEKSNRKLSWLVDEVNEKVDAQIDKRDFIVSKYTNIFSKMNRKLSELEQTKKCTTKVKEDIIKQKNLTMKNKISNSSQKGRDSIQKDCQIINDLVSSGAAYIDTVKTQHMKKVEGVRIAENEYYHRHFKDNYEHKTQMDVLKDKGEKLIEEYWDEDYNCEVLGPSIYKDKTKRKIKEFIVEDLERNKNEIKNFEDEILQLNSILNEQTKRIQDMESKIKM